jgi:hypothetical protein
MANAGKCHAGLTGGTGNLGYETIMLLQKGPSHQQSDVPVKPGAFSSIHKGSQMYRSMPRVAKLHVTDIGKI